MAIIDQDYEYELDELVEMVLEWANEKGIMDKGTACGQASKMLEEANETYNAVIETGIRGDIKDGIGDTFVTLIILAEMHGWRPTDCIHQALKVITKRTGKMENGVFVKDE
ncbi:MULTISPECIES: ArpR [unclassified Thioalkalivibrio]|uniref:ArpR n=1 Tax=unclassified Thioalkalivibrio TaxID=2621013 RepID=UPI00035CA4B6|nr:MULTISPECIES: ArpR [unclassified Thioalkalivibrio]